MTDLNVLLTDYYAAECHFTSLTVGLCGAESQLICNLYRAPLMSLASFGVLKTITHENFCNSDLCYLDIQFVPKKLR